MHAVGQEELSLLGSSGLGDVCSVLLLGTLGTKLLWRVVMLSLQSVTHSLFSVSRTGRDLLSLVMEMPVHLF